MNTSPVIFNESNLQLDHRASIGESLSGKSKEVFQYGSNIRETVHNSIAGRVASLILLPTNNINPETTLSAFGVESMLAAQLRTYIYQASAVDIPFQTTIGNTTSISSLADVTAKEITGEQSALSWLLVLGRLVFIPFRGLSSVKIF